MKPVFLFSNLIGLFFRVEILNMNINIKSITNFYIFVLNEAYLNAPVSCKKKQLSNFLFIFTLTCILPQDTLLYPCKLCGGYTVFKVSVRPSVRASVTFCFLNILSHCWIFIKPCKHVHICKTNTLDKKVRARGQFY